MNQNRLEDEISLVELFNILKLDIHIVILWILGIFAVVAVYTFLIIEPVYQSSSRIVVSQTEVANDNLTNNDINTNLNLITTYQSIIKEPIILEEVIEKTNANETVSSLRGKISFQTESNSLVFGLVVNDDNPSMAADIANTTAEVFQEKIGDILPVESVTILSTAVADWSPVSPNIPLNLAIGSMLGAMVGIGHVFLKNILDKRVKTADIITDLGLTHLGTINEMSSKEIKEISANQLDEFVLPVFFQEERTSRVSN